MNINNLTKKRETVSFEDISTQPIIDISNSEEEVSDTVYSTDNVEYTENNTQDIESQQIIETNKLTEQEAIESTSNLNINDIKLRETVIDFNSTTSKLLHINPVLDTDLEPIPESSTLTQLFGSLEALSIEIMKENEIKNISLCSFGPYNDIFVPNILNIINFGLHKFIGTSYSEIDKSRLFYLINEQFIAHPSEKEIVIKLVHKFRYSGVYYYSLVATEDDLLEYSSIFGRQVYITSDEVDIDLLCAVIVNSSGE